MVFYWTTLDCFSLLVLDLRILSYTHSIAILISQFEPPNKPSFSQWLEVWGNQNTCISVPKSNPLVC